MIAVAAETGIPPQALIDDPRWLDGIIAYLQWRASEQERRNRG